MLSRVTKTTSRGGQEPHKSLNPFHAGHEDQLCDTDSSSRVPSMSESSDSSFSFSASASPLSARSNLPSLRRTQKDVAALPVQRRPTPSTTARQRAPSDSQLNSDVNAIPDLRQGVDATASETNTRLSVGQALGAAIADAVDLPAPPRLSANGLQLDLRPRDSSHTISSISTLQPASLRSVRDLGVDYTRYFVPQRASTQSPGETSRLLQGYDTDGARGTDDWSHVPCAASSDDEASMHGRTKSGPASLSACKAMGAGHGDTGVKRTSSTPSMQCMSTLSNVPRDASATPAGRDAHFFPYLDDRFGAPDTAGSGYNFPMYWDEKEADDDMHTPMSDDDTRLKPKFRDHFTRDNICSTIGLVSMVLGLLILFVMLPILSAIDIDGDGYSYKTEDNGPGSARPWDWVNDETHALMKHIRSGLIDEDTPYSALTREAYDGSTLKLVFSDEFNDGHRTFYAGDDPFFRGFDGWYGSTQDLEWYDPDAVTTYNGSLELRLDAFPNRGLQYRSGMLQSWNQLCFKGSVFEVSVSLPGPAGVQGLWPGVWTMGNLGRPGYLATTEGTWPYTYSACDAGITPNQSMSDGTSKLPGQKLTSCGCRGSDHPTPGTGRGAPEIDIIEALASWGGTGLALATQSYQVAPFDIWYYPNYDFFETPDYSISFINTYTGGPYQQAVSTTTMLNNSWYDGLLYQKYAFEYTPGSDAKAGVKWWVSDEMTAGFDARALGPNGNVGQRLVSEEPMSLILNLGLSNSWVNIDWTRLEFPTTMRVDYIRWYQPEGAELITCDPPGYETTEYIAKHAEAYNNANYTHWTDIPGYTWPKNSLMNEC